MIRTTQMIKYTTIATITHVIIKAHIVLKLSSSEGQVVVLEYDIYLA